MNQLVKYGTSLVVEQILIQHLIWEYLESKISFNKKKKESYTFLQMEKTTTHKKLLQIFKKNLLFKKTIGLTRIKN
jgi:hypothetical protein